MIDGYINCHYIDNTFHFNGVRYDDAEAVTPSYDLVLYNGDISNLINKVVDFSSKKEGQGKTQIPRFVLRFRLKGSDESLCSGAESFIYLTWEEEKNSVATTENINNNGYYELKQIPSTLSGKNIKITLHIESLSDSNILILTNNESDTEFNFTMEIALMKDSNSLSEKAIAIKPNIFNLAQDIEKITTELREDNVIEFNNYENEFYFEKIKEKLNLKNKTLHFRYSGYDTQTYFIPIDPPTNVNIWLNNLSPIDFGLFEYSSQTNYRMIPSLDRNADVADYYDETGHFKDYYFPLVLLPDITYEVVYNANYENYGGAFWAYEIYPLDINFNHIFAYGDCLPNPLALRNILGCQGQYKLTPFNFKIPIVEDEPPRSSSYIYSINIKDIVGGKAEDIENWFMSQGENGMTFAEIIEDLSKHGIWISNSPNNRVHTGDQTFNSNHEYYITQNVLDPSGNMTWTVNENFLNWILGKQMGCFVDFSLAPYVYNMNLAFSEDLISEYLTEMQNLMQSDPFDEHYQKYEYVLGLSQREGGAMPIPYEYVPAVHYFADAIFIVDGYFIWTGTNKPQPMYKIYWDGVSSTTGIDPNALGWLEREGDIGGVHFSTTEDTTFDSSKIYFAESPHDHDIVDPLITGNAYDTEFSSNSYHYYINDTLTNCGIYAQPFCINKTYDNILSTQIYGTPPNSVECHQPVTEETIKEVLSFSQKIINSYTTPGTYVLKSTITEVIDDPSTTPPETHLETTYNWVLETT